MLSSFLVENISRMSLVSGYVIYMKSDGKIENDLASIFFFGIYYIVSGYIISIPIIYNMI